MAACFHSGDLASMPPILAVMSVVATGRFGSAENRDEPTGMRCGFQDGLNPLSQPDDCSSGRPRFPCFGHIAVRMSCESAMLTCVVSQKAGGTMTSPAPVGILWGGLTAGVLDGLDALVF